MPIFRVALPFAFLALTACGGSSATAPASFDQLQSRGNALFDQLDANERTDFAALPKTGSARFTGVAAVIVGDDGALGDLGLDVNFGKGTVVGSARNFYSVDERPTAGALTISGGRIADQGGTQIRAQVAGNVTLDGGTIRIDQSIRGSFGGTRGDTLAMSGEGAAVRGGGSRVLAGVVVIAGR